MSVLDLLVASGTIRSFDRHLAASLTRQVFETDERVCVAVALLSSAAGNGQACLSLPSIASTTLLRSDDGEFVCPSQSDWEEALRRCALVDANGNGPLVLDDNGRLYFQRLWRYEGRIAQALAGRFEATDEDVEPKVLAVALRRWFPSLPADAQLGNEDLEDAPLAVDGQMLAAALAARRNVLVITGGPGTGKTTTLARTVALLLELSLADQEHDASEAKKMRVALAAPTGKGANRALTALSDALDGLDIPQPMRRLLPREAQTLHRLLGASANSGRFRYGVDRQLPLDLLVVDEASMVDLRLMTRLLDALPTSAKLLLVGDPDQLASIEPGAVLAEISAATSGVTRETALAIASATGVELAPADIAGHEEDWPNSHVNLRRRYRFSDDSGLADIADAVRAGDSAVAIAMMNDAPSITLSPILATSDAAALDQVMRTAMGGYQPYLDQIMAGASSNELLGALGEFQVLSPFRYGPLGTDVLNREFELRMRRTIRADDRLAPSDYFHGQAVLITRNDYAAGLFNGDVGVILAREQDGPARVDFLADGTGREPGKARSVALGRVAHWESAYALTVHKSQGSEFTNVLLVLPRREARATEPAVTRELFYTAITRARRGVTILADMEVLEEAIATPIRRASGLASRLRTLRRVAGHGAPSAPAAILASSLANAGEARAGALDGELLETSRESQTSDSLLVSSKPQSSATLGPAHTGHVISPGTSTQAPAGTSAGNSIGSPTGAKAPDNSGQRGPTQRDAVRTHAAAADTDADTDAGSMGKEARVDGQILLNKSSNDARAGQGTDDEDPEQGELF